MNWCRLQFARNAQASFRRALLPARVFHEDEDRCDQPPAPRQPRRGFHPSISNVREGVHDDPESNALHLGCWRTGWSDGSAIKRRSFHFRWRRPGHGFIGKDIRRSSSAASSCACGSSLASSGWKASVLRQWTSARRQPMRSPIRLLEMRCRLLIRYHRPVGQNGPRCGGSRTYAPADCP